MRWRCILGKGLVKMAETRTSLPETLAPWAEVVPEAERTTVDDLLTRPDDGWRYEVVEGVLIRMAGSGEEAANIAGIIFSVLFAYVRPRRLGRVTPADGVYIFPGAETGLLPDVGYYGAALFPRVADRKRPIPFAPELAVEVVSPEQTAADMAAKAARYLGGGTRLVWIVWPDARAIDVWHPGDVGRPSVTLRADISDLLDGEDVIPGFSHPAADVFDI
jgi:Uma2 family endonuclease